MKICIDTRSIHPHMAPFAASLAKHLNVSDKLTYVYRSTPNDPNRAVGAQGLVDDVAMFWLGTDEPCEGRDAVLNADVLIENHRDFDLLDIRKAQGKLTIYQSERWFKPIGVLGLRVPGFIRMFFPFGIRRAIRIMRLFKSNDFYYFPLGLHAAQDMARLCGLMNGDLRCLFAAPKLSAEKKPCGKIYLAGSGDGRQYCLERMRVWGYYVKHSENIDLSVRKVSKTRSREINALWVGRLLKLKRVDTIVRAVSEHEKMRCLDDSLPRIILDIYGDGPEKMHLVKQARGYENIIRFHNSVPYNQIRQIMYEHDVYILSSNQFEGWGAVINEALEENMIVLGAADTGAATVMLPNEAQFRSGDWRRLLGLLQSHIPHEGIGCWAADCAAKAFLDFVGEIRC